MERAAAKLTQGTGLPGTANSCQSETTPRSHSRQAPHTQGDLPGERTAPGPARAAGQKSVGAGTPFR